MFYFFDNYMGNACICIGKGCISVGTCGNSQSIYQEEAAAAVSNSSNSSLTKKKKRKAWSNHQVIQIHKKTQGNCMYCDKSVGEALNRIGRWEIDHLVPIAKGGQDHIQNAVVSCVPCNSYKSDKPVELLYENRNFLVGNPHHTGRRCEKLLLNSGVFCTNRFHQYTETYCYIHK
jgi:hypothetical protein